MNFAEFQKRRGKTSKDKDPVGMKKIENDIFANAG